MAGTEQRIEPAEAQGRKAEELCQQIRNAAELMDTTLDLMDIANRRMTDARLETFPFGESPTQFKVEIPEGARAYVTEDDDVVDEGPRAFVATSLEHLGREGIAGGKVAIFTNHLTGQRLRIEGLKFDIYPLEEGSTEA